MAEASFVETAALHAVKKEMNGFSDFDFCAQGPAKSATKALEQYIHVERHPNGGASVVHMYQREFQSLSVAQKEELATRFFQEVFSEQPVGMARHVMGIVHGAAEHLPEMVDYLSASHGELVVKAGHLRKSEIETVKMEEYAERVRASYCQGTTRCGPLLQVSLVGQVSEESGGYLPALLGEFLYSSSLACWSMCVCAQICWRSVPS